MCATRRFEIFLMTNTRTWFREFSSGLLQGLREALKMFFFPLRDFPGASDDTGRK